MPEREIRVPTPDGEMKTFVVHPDSAEPLPVAVLFMDGVGYREQIKANARRFAAAGYYCVAPDLFYRAGDGVTVDFAKVQAEGPDGPAAQQLRKAISEVTPEHLATDTRALLDAVAGDPAASPGPKVCVGYCMGVRAALRAAAALPDEFVAAAGIHPGPLVTDQADSPHRDLGSVRGELYFAFSENDRADTAAGSEALRQEMGRHAVRGEVERLAGTTHGFAMADLPVYDRDASERHFERTLELWRRNLAREASKQPV